MTSRVVCNEEDRKVLAYHEAGHAVYGWSRGLKIRGITIALNGRITGRTDYFNPLPPSLARDVAIALAGIASEVVHFGAKRSTTFGGDDWSVIADLAKTDFVNVRRIMDLVILSLSTADNRRRVIAVADALLKYETLDDEQFAVHCPGKPAIATNGRFP